MPEARPERPAESDGARRAALFRLSMQIARMIIPARHSTNTATASPRKRGALDQVLVDAAMDRFSSYGYRGTSPARIACAAGVTNGSATADCRYDMQPSMSGYFAWIVISRSPPGYWKAAWSNDGALSILRASFEKPYTSCGMPIRFLRISPVPSSSWNAATA